MRYTAFSTTSSTSFCGQHVQLRCFCIEASAAHGFVQVRFEDIANDLLEPRFWPADWSRDPASQFSGSMAESDPARRAAFEAGDVERAQALADQVITDGPSVSKLESTLADCKTAAELYEQPRRSELLSVAAQFGRKFWRETR